MNVAIGHSASLSTVAFCLPVLLRIIFGCFSRFSLVGFYYLWSFSVTLFLSLLTIKAVLCTAFITHFDYMSSFSDKTVLLSTVSLSVLASLARILLELVQKTVEDTKHLGQLVTLSFLGAEEEDMNPSPWTLSSSIISLALYALASAVHFGIKWKRSRQSQGLVTSNQTSRLESSANGVTFWASVGLLVMAFTSLTLFLYARKVGTHIFFFYPAYISLFQKYDTNCKRHLLDLTAHHNML